MTLELQCRESAGYVSSLKGVGAGRARTGGGVVAFNLCENHSQLFQMVDAELVEEGWAPSFMGRKPTPL